MLKNQRGYTVEDEYKTEQAQKILPSKLKKECEGVISYDDAKKLAGVK